MPNEGTLHGRSEQQHQRRKGTRKAAPAQARPASKWFELQKVQREFEQGEKTVAVLTVLSKQCRAANSVVPASELVAAIAKAHQRLDGSVRWVYLSEDLDDDTQME